MKKLTILLALILTINLVSAINLDITKKEISNTIIPSINKPAEFELTIRNLGISDNFEIYTLVGLNIEPTESIHLEQGETKTIPIKIYTPQDFLQRRHFSFEYKIKDSDKNIQKESLIVNILDLNQMLSFEPEPINPNTKIINIKIKNKLEKEINNLEINLNSIFFEDTQTISLKKSEEKTIQIPLNKKETGITAGNYIMVADFNYFDKNIKTESLIKFLEKEGIETNTQKEGFLIQRNEITKKNIGNTQKTVEIKTTKNIIAYLFTTTNFAPITKFNGLNVEYSWSKKLIPHEEYKIILKTNWLFPILIIVLIFGVYFFIKKSLESELELNKKVSYVNTKGGEFALKVTLKLKANSFIEKINVIDRIPHIVDLYKRFGAISPDKIDEKNKRLEWNVESLNKGEERIFSYIIYSKIGIFGKFELPSAKVIYEKEEKLKEKDSNRSFFINKSS